MDKELKAKWLEALRSGDFPKTKGRLKSARARGTGVAGFCCLGVLCEVIEPGSCDRWARNEAGYLASQHGYIPEKLAGTAGIDEQKQVELATLNDAFGSNDFTSVIGVIERDL